MNWSEQQTAIFRWFRSGNGNLVVRARAGTGKTTTIIQGIEHAPERQILLAAFNVRNAKDLDRRVRSPSITAATLHSVGYRIVRRMWEGVRAERPEERGFRAASLAQAACGDQAPDAILRMVAKLCSLAREQAPFAERAEDLEAIAWDFDCIPSADWEDYGWGAETVCAAALKAMEIAKLRPAYGIIDFSDQLYLPLANRWARPLFDLVVVDEAQDMNLAQLELARRVCRGRFVAVGDDRQAIYRFRGADSRSLDRIKLEMSCAELGLTVTYRCGAAIVQEAQVLVPDYHAAPSNPPGEVRFLVLDKLLDELQVGDVVLSRSNGPLIRWCLAILKTGVAARVEGKDLAAALRALIRDLATGRARGSMPAFLERLAAWEAKEVARALASGEAGAGRAESVRDRADALRQLSEGVSGIPELQARIEQIFAEISASRCVVLMTVHKAKGMEWPRVFLLEDTFRSGGEEDNIRYVAITRAERELVKAFDPNAKREQQQAPGRAAA